MAPQTSMYHSVMHDFSSLMTLLEPFMVCCKDVDLVVGNKFSITLPRTAIHIIERSCARTLAFHLNFLVSDKGSEHVLEVRHLNSFDLQCQQTQIIVLDGSCPLMLPIHNWDLITANYERHDRFVQIYCSSHPTNVYIAWQWSRKPALLVSGCLPSPPVGQIFFDIFRYCNSCKGVMYANYLKDCEDCQLFDSCARLYEKCKTARQAVQMKKGGALSESEVILNHLRGQEVWHVRSLCMRERRRKSVVSALF